MSDQPSPTLTNPLAAVSNGGRSAEPTLYERTLAKGEALRARPLEASGVPARIKQHHKGRMTVWERIDALKDPGSEPTVLFQNWGPKLDGASIVTAVVDVGGRPTAVYGHDFTVRAGSMDATNGRKIARLMRMAGERGIPLVGMNDSAGAYVPAGVGGLDGYSTAFTALRSISGVVPTVMCMFGFNAGGGAYLPRQGSFVIQPRDTFFGLTGPGVVKSVLGEDVTAAELGGPGVHSQTGVADLTAEDELGALRMARRLLSYLPSNHHQGPPTRTSSDPLQRPTWAIDTLLRKAIDSPTGFNTPFDASILIQEICDHGEYFELQPTRARNLITAFGRLDGDVVGFVANNSAVSSGQIDIDASLKCARFVRFCNVYNIPMIFLEDTTGFLPGTDQEHNGIVQAGRAMLDSIIDLRTPRLLLIVRNAFGGAYCAFNCYPTGADHVLALPTTRLAVMGPAGKEFVFKKELRAARASVPERIADAMAEGASEAEATEAARAWLAGVEAELSVRYEDQLMNPNEALSLGSISEIVQPVDVRRALGTSLRFHLSHYRPGPMQGVQREFH
jgi:acetyl-CoA carboxylase carboxyltransferase component